MTQLDVCVIGGGPAGAALTTRLALLGHHVAVVERHRFACPHVGESLSPAIWPLLETLGVHDQVTTSGLTSAVAARVRWRGDDEERMHVGDELTVDRGAFDALVLDRAREAGADVLPPLALARRPMRSGDEGWQVPLGERVLHARVLADTTGHRRLLGGRAALTSPRTLALHGIVSWRRCSTGCPPRRRWPRLSATGTACSPPVAHWRSRPGCASGVCSRSCLPDLSLALQSNFPPSIERVACIVATS